MLSCIAKAIVWNGAYEFLITAWGRTTNLEYLCIPRMLLHLNFLKVVVPTPAKQPWMQLDVDAEVAFDLGAQWGLRQTNLTTKISE